MRVYCEKLGLSSPDDADLDDSGSDHLDWGHRQEPVIAQWYADTNRCELLPGGQIACSDYPFLWATLDRKVIGQPILVECKNVGSPHFYRHWNTSDPDGVPNYVRAQVTIALAFTCAGRCDVVASIGGRPPHIWTVWPDDKLACNLIGRALSFWTDAINRVPPPLDETDSTRAFLLSRYPENTDPRLVEASSIVDDMGRLRKKLSSRMSGDVRELQRIDNEILSSVGDCDGIRGDGWKMTWRTDKNGVRRSRFTATGEAE